MVSSGSPPSFSPLVARPGHTDAQVGGLGLVLRRDGDVVFAEVSYSFIAYNASSEGYKNPGPSRQFGARLLPAVDMITPA